MTTSNSSTASAAPVLLVDTHVHIYDCYDLDALFDAAARNFAHAAGRLGVSAAPRQGMLLLTETVNDHYFDGLAAGERKPSRWRVQKTSELAVLKLTCAGRDDLLLVAGRQIATAEDLEVLALGTTERFPDKRPITESLAAVDRSAAMTALPWGFGKWWGHRGTIIGKLLAAPRNRPLYSGDNGGRLSWSSQPQLLIQGEERGHKVLPGTDPLPFPGQERRVATYGLLIRNWDPAMPPLEQLTARLAMPNERPVQFGGLTGLVPFVRLQIAMQLRKRARRGVAA